MGILGKIRAGIEEFFLSEEILPFYPISAEPFMMTTGYSEGADYAYLWSLGQYRDTVKREKQEEKWDELEKSVIASVADDVIVGIKGKRVDIVIVKNFA